MLELNKIYNMDCLKGLKQLPDNGMEKAIVNTAKTWSAPHSDYEGGKPCYERKGKN